MKPIDTSEVCDYIWAIERGGLIQPTGKQYVCTRLYLLSNKRYPVSPAKPDLTGNIRLMTKIPELGRTKNLAVKGDILMRSKPKALLSIIMVVVFVLSMVATISAAGHPLLYVCCTKVLKNGTVINGTKIYGMPDATCSYELCVEVGEFCTCSKTK